MTSKDIEKWKAEELSKEINKKFEEIRKAKEKLDSEFIELKEKYKNYRSLYDEFKKI